MRTLLLNQRKISALLTYLTMGIALIISLIYTPVMIRLLGQNEYGLYNFSASIVAYLGVLNFGFGSTYIRFFSRYKKNNEKENISKLNGTFLLIFIFISILVLLIGLVLAYFSNNIFGPNLTFQELEIAKTLLIVLTINLSLKFISIVFESYILANEKFIFQKFIYLIHTILNPLIILPILYLGYGSIGMALAIACLSTFSQFLYVLYALLKLKMKFTFINLEKKVLIEIISFSFFIFISLLIDQVNWNVDKYLLGRFHGTISVAIYSVSSIFNSQYLQLSTAISSVYIPEVNRLVNSINSNSSLTNLFIKIGRIQFIILTLFLSGFVFFGQEFISLWVGEEYKSSYYIIIILLTAVTIPISQNIGIEIQRAKGLVKFRSTIYLLIAFLNVIISIPLIILFEGIGASIGTALALILGNVVIMNIYYHKKVGLNIKMYWKELFYIFPGFLIPFLLGGLYISFFNINNKVIYLIIGITFYTIFFMLSVYKFSLKKYEKDLFIRPILYLINLLKTKRNIKKDN